MTLAILLALAMAACAPSPPQSGVSTPPPPPSVASANPIVSAPLELLEQLEVKGRAPATGYARTQFGQRWSDDVSVEFGHNGCDTRNDILRRDLVNAALKPGTHGCVVLSGELFDPYSGEVIEFERGPRSAEVQIDHVVALSNAWQTGAQQLSASTRRDFANDPRNLLAVSGAQNQQKGAGDAATWLPRNTAFRCTYAATQVEVKHAYHLWVTPPEKEALTRILLGCANRSGSKRPER